MTTAVCLSCGAIKFGAWTECHECGFTPEDDESLTKHLLATDHYLSEEALEGISADIKAGKEIEFSQESLEAASVNSSHIRRLPRGCWIYLAAAVLTVILLVYLLVQLL